MTKKDIARNDLVLLRDGRICVVLNDMDNPNDGLTLYGKTDSSIPLFSNPNENTSLGKIAHIYSYEDNLLIDSDKSLGGYDIMAVRKTSDCGLKYSVSFIFNILFYSCKEPNRIFWDWQREEIKEVTMAEVEEKFGCKVKIVKEEDDE